MKRPYFNGKRSFIVCPNCGVIFFNRRFSACPSCNIGLKMGSELICQGDYYWKDGKWVNYEELLKIAIV